MSYELKQSDIYDFAEAVGAATRKEGQELFFELCPYCRGGASGDKKTFSVNLSTGFFKCFRASCDKHGHFVTLARDFGYHLDFGDNGRRREYRQLPQRPIVIRDSALEYMASRGISREIAQGYKITAQTGNPNVVVFPFYDENGVLQFVKYRKTDFDKNRDKNKEWSEKDTKPILFGMNHCFSDGSLVITEGQIDSLSLAECGIPNAVSVPTGATGMTWIENCWDFLMRFDEIVIFGDCERGKITLVDRIAERVPKPIRVVRVEDYLGEKDANDILRKYGKEAIAYAVQNAAELIVNHIKELADVEAVDLESMDKITTGFPEVDRIIGGFFYGQVILLTGKRGQGKSTLMSQIIANALNQDVRTLAYSGELPDYHFRRWLDLQLAGTDNLTEKTNAFGDKTYSIPDDVVERIGGWYRGKAYIYDNNAIMDDEQECEQLLDTIELAIQRHGIRFVCIDNLMTALDVDLDKDIYRAQSKFLKRLKLIAVKYNIVVLLVAHPRKTKDDVVIEDIAGSGDISNRVDVVISYSRVDGDGADCDGKVQIFKNRLTGRTTGKEGIELYYSEASKQIVSKLSGRWRYGWKYFKATPRETITKEDLPF